MGTAEERYPVTSAAAWIVPGGGAPLRVHTAEKFMEQFMGLMGVRAVERGFGLWFPDCRSIHMFFMKVPIDAVWLGPVGPFGRARVLRVDRGLAPGKLAFAPRGAESVMECAAGSVPRRVEAVCMPWSA